MWTEKTLAEWKFYYYTTGNFKLRWTVLEVSVLFCFIFLFDDSDVRPSGTEKFIVEGNWLWDKYGSNQMAWRLGKVWISLFYCQLRIRKTRISEQFYSAKNRHWGRRFVYIYIYIYIQNSTKKDKLPIFKQSNLIYKFVCRCNST